jgi:hypothetical protein
MLWGARCRSRTYVTIFAFAALLGPQVAIGARAAAIEPGTVREQLIELNRDLIDLMGVVESTPRSSMYTQIPGLQKIAQRAEKLESSFADKFNWNRRPSEMQKAEKRWSCLYRVASDIASNARSTSDSLALFIRSNGDGGSEAFSRDKLRAADRKIDCP